MPDLPIVQSLRALIENKFRQAARTKASSKMSLLEWGMEYFPHFFFRSYSQLHHTLANIYDDITVNRGQRLNIIAPRGNAKTTWAQVKILKAICEASEHYILLISDTAKQAQGLLDTIKIELESNEKLRRDYPVLLAKSAVWNNLRIETPNGICVEALGTGQKVRGLKYKQYRPTLILVDDPDNDDDVRSPTTRVQHIEWFVKALEKCGDTETNIVVVGTMLHRECIVGTLEKRPDYKTIKFQSIMTWPDRMDLWAEWETLYWSAPLKISKDGITTREDNKASAFYDLHYDEMNAGATVLWPEKEDLYKLMEMRASAGHAAFASEKQNDPRDPSKCEFPEEWFDGTDYEYEELQKRLSSGEDRVTVLVADPAKGGDTKKHDYSPILALHFFGDAYCYVEIEMNKIPVNTLTDRICDWHQILKPQVVGFEANGFQELIGNEIFYKAKERNLFNLNVMPIENYGIHKNSRISRLSVWLNKKFFKFRANCPHAKLLIQQLKDHPHADHDDGSDALEMAMRLLTQITDGRSSFEASDDNLPERIR
jgi:hypothetical protein